jgi:hypothetical protein
MARSFISQLGQQTAEHALDKLHRVAQSKAADLEMKPKRDTLNKFFPEEVSNLILQLPERDQWSAIQQLAQGYGHEGGGNQDQGLEQIKQQGQLGPQGSQAIDQQLQGAMGRESNGLPLAQQVQQPAVGNQEFNNQQVGQGQQRQKRPTLGEALGGGKGGESKEEAKSAHTYVNEVRNRNKKAKEIKNLLGKMYKYHKSGKLSGPLKASLIDFAKVKGYGPNLSWLLSKESQGFNKIGVSFLKYAKDYLGSKMTEKEAYSFLEQFPSLINTKEGRDEIFEIWKDMLASDFEEENAVESIIKNNGGKIPSNIRGIVSELGSKKNKNTSEGF